MQCLYFLYRQRIIVIVPNSKHNHLFEMNCVKCLSIISYKIDQVYWPRKYKAWQKDCHAIQGIHVRIDNEVFVTLYAQQPIYKDANGNDVKMSHCHFLDYCHNTHVYARKF